MKLLLYCTKSKPRLFFDKLKQIFSLGKIKSNNDLNGKIVAECDFEVEEMFYDLYGDLDWQHDYLPTTKTMSIINLENASCLDREEIEKEMNDNKGYAIHINNLHIFDKPRDIRDYSKNENPYNYIENAPQNMMYAFDVKSFNESEKKVLISIRPQWLCKILNGEKTIEIRRRVLREMIK